MKSPFLRRAGWARPPLWLVGTVVLLPLWALAQATPPPEPAPANGTPAPEATQEATDDAAVETLAPSSTRRTPRTRAPAPPRFDVDLQAGNDELRDFLLRHMELMRFRTLRDLDASELDRLLGKTPDDLGNLLGTLGHFAPEIHIDEPAATGPTPLGTVRIRVDPGPITRVESADLYFLGDIANNPQATAQREAVTRAWTLKPGQSFTQADWSSAKTNVLRALTARRYPTGRVANSLADIDPKTHSARLSVELDSGAPLRVGEVRVEGAERYEAATVEHLVHLSGLRPGSDYDLDQLQDAQQRIAAAGSYDSVFVFVDTDHPQDGTAPVVVQLRESPRQKLVLGVGGSTDNGARLSAEYTHHRVPGLGWQSVNKLQLEREDQLLSSQWSAPVDSQGWRWIASAQMARQIDGFDTTTSQRLRAGRSQDSTPLDRSYFLQFERARAENAVLGSPETTHAESALSVNYAWTRRRFDSMPLPKTGNGLGMEIGVGTTLESPRRPFVRLHTRWLGYWPIDSGVSALANSLEGLVRRGAPPLGVARPSDDETGQAGRLALRLEGGALWARKDAGIPETLLYLTGGDTSVRGYGLRDIGIPQADGGVSPGRYLAVASVEWQRPIWRDGVRTPWESVVFVDAGAVANEPGDLRPPQWGVGAGVRYNSPVGPLQLDLAYGVKPKALRLHFNVGFTF